MSKEMEISVAEFPGFKFSPTEEELILYYLKKKIEGFDKCVEVIAEIDITQYEPWDLPAKSVIQSDNEWFFFSSRGRKYPKGLQSRRATESGYWKATGKERSVKSGSNVVGTKRTLVFHRGRAPKGERTEWIMHEYCMSGTSQDSMVICRLRRNCEFRSSDTPRRGSINGRHSSTKDSNAVALAEDGLQHKGVFEGDDVIESFYKDCSSSDNCQLVDQIDSGYESEQKRTNNVSQDGSCSLKKYCDGEDDCFADILKDDIVKLDESFPSTTPDVVAEVATQSMYEIKLAYPVQGTANRRIRFKRHEDITYHVKPMEAFKSRGDKDSAAAGSCSRSQQPHCVIGLLSYMKVNRWRISVILVIMLLLISFLPWLIRFWQVKDFSHPFFL